MSTPEQRFEVPPEYAEVYERAYRRAYEEGQGQLSGALLTAPPPRKTNSRGKRVAVPQQRSRARSARPVPSQPTRRAVVPAPAARHEKSTRKAPRNVRERSGRRARVTDRRSGHRADPVAGSTLLPVLGLLGLMALLLIGAFLLGRVTAGTVSSAAAPTTGTGPAASASATEGPADAPSATPPYAGPQTPIQVDSLTATCTSGPSIGAGSQPVTFNAVNVLDDDPNTAWRCDGLAVGTELTFGLPAGSTVVSVGLVPGYATSDPSTGVDRYAENNRITKVSYTFDNGYSLVQSIQDDPLDRSLRAVAIPATATRTVTLRILGVVEGESDSTMISTVVLQGAP